MVFILDPVLDRITGRYRNQSITFDVDELSEWICHEMSSNGVKPTSLTVYDFKHWIIKAMIIKYVRCIDYVN